MHGARIGSAVLWVVSLVGWTASCSVQTDAVDGKTSALTVDTHAPPPLPRKQDTSPNSRSGMVTLPSEALVPKPVSEEDLRALPTNKYSQGRRDDTTKLKPDSQSENAARRTLAAPSADLLRRQQDFIEAWKAQKESLDKLPPDQREAALSALKQSYLGGAL